MPLLNPRIHDIAAYDFWAKPLGLLMLGGCLRAAGAKAFNRCAFVLLAREPAPVTHGPANTAPRGREVGG